MPIRNSYTHFKGHTVYFAGAKVPNDDLLLQSHLTYGEILQQPYVRISSPSLMTVPILFIFKYKYWQRQSVYAG